MDLDVKFENLGPYVKINRSSSEIKYDDNKNMWSADIIFDVYQRAIYIYGTSRTLTETERSNVITEILNKFFFNYMYKINLRKLFIL